MIVVKFVCRNPECKLYYKEETQFNTKIYFDKTTEEVKYKDTECPSCGELRKVLKETTFTGYTKNMIGNNIGKG